MGNNGFKNKKQILLVDDDKHVTQMLALILESRGYHVEVARSGSEGIQKAARSPDLILLDLILPDQAGFDVCRKLKEEKNTRHIPIIMLTAKDLFEDKVEGLYLGADDYLTKPFENEELFARMEAVMRRNFFMGAQSTNGEKTVIVELRRIIADELIVPFFQPIYFLKPFKLFGLEILSRPPRGSILSDPELLFRAALKFGFYSDLEVCAWRKALDVIGPQLTDEKLFLNCNPYLVEGQRVDDIKKLFNDHKISIDQVILEITERSAITNYKVFYDLLKTYRHEGFRFAVDDVGGGYASLESIVETRPEVLKIDRHIIRDIHQDLFKKSIVKFIVAFCKENNIISIAEGIETKEELMAVMELGVDAGQGYYLGRPVCEVNMQELKSKKLSQK